MNLAKELIEIDKRFGLPWLTEGDALFKKFFKDLSSNIKTIKRPIEKKFVKVILSKVKEWFIENDFKYLEEAIPLSISFSTKRISCIGYSILYHSLGQENSLPIFCYNAPQHIFVRWETDKFIYCNWETTAPPPGGNACFTNEREFAGKKITEKQLKNGIFLQKLTKEQIFARYYNLLGGYFDKRDEKDSAKECSEMALQYDQKYPQGQSALASLISKSFPDELEKAEKLFKESLEIDPESPNTNCNYGQYLKNHVKDSELDQRKHFEAALQIDPNCHSSRCELAHLLYYHFKEYEAAIKLLEEGITLKSPWAFFYNSLGVYTYEQYPAKGEETKEYYEKAIELNPVDPIAYENLSELYEKRLNDPQKAKEYLIIAQEKWALKES